MKNSRIIVVSSFLIVLLASACKHEYTPKPKGFFRIDFPEKQYVQSEVEGPYSFDYPVYAKIDNDYSSLAEPYWYNISIAENNAKIHLSYKTVNNNLAELIEDSRELAYKHSIKANTINEKLYMNSEKQVYGTIYELKGNVASPMQLHLTDSSNHFLRASFYISEIPNYDSLSPVIKFIEEDIYHLIESLSWK